MAADDYRKVTFRRIGNSNAFVVVTRTPKPKAKPARRKSKLNAEQQTQAMIWKTFANQD